MKTKTEPEAMARMHFLYRAAHSINCVSTRNTTKHTSKDLSARSRNATRIMSTHLTRLMIGIGRKAVQRASIEVKRTICKGCRNILLPGKNATVSYNVSSKKTKYLRIVCEQGRTQKRFPRQKLAKRKQN